MNLDDIKAIQQVADTKECTNLIFCGNTASFLKSNLPLQIWKDRGQFSTFVQNKENLKLFSLSALARMLSQNIDEPHHGACQRK